MRVARADQRAPGYVRRILRLPAGYVVKLGPVGLAMVALTLGCGGDTPEGSGSLPLVSVAYGEWNVSEVPALPRGPEGAWDGGLVDPGAVIFHQGRFHMLYNGIPLWPTPLWVGYASSIEGLAWERETESPVFAPEPVPFGGWTVRATSLIVENDTWVLYYAVGLEEGNLEGVIGRATSPSPEGPWSIDELPVFTTGEPGTWDAGTVGHAKVMPDAQGYVMYYTGWSAGRTAIGRAVSTDGITWTRDPDPVLEPPPAESETDRWHVSDPTVLRTPDAGWLMFYRLTGGTSHPVLGTATSTDGVRWTRGAPVTRADDDLALTTIFYSNARATQTHQLVYFEAGEPGTDNTNIWVATREVRVGPR